MSLIWTFAQTNNYYANIWKHRIRSYYSALAYSFPYIIWSLTHNSLYQTIYHLFNSNIELCIISVEMIQLTKAFSDVRQRFTIRTVQNRPSNRSSEKHQNLATAYLSGVKSAIYSFNGQFGKFRVYFTGFNNQLPDNKLRCLVSRRFRITRKSWRDVSSLLIVIFYRIHTV